jgi:hypothetical protein
MTETVEGVAVELVSAPAAQSLVAASTPSQTIEAHVAVANELRKIISKQKLSLNVRGKEHVLVTGWQTLGLLCPITAVVTDTQPIDGGFMATCEARRTTDGMVVGRAQAICTNDEKQGPWKTADRYALLSMAQTRATSKALKQAVGPLMQLAGYEPLGAEEAIGVPDQVAAPVAGRGGSVAGVAITEKQAGLVRAKSAQKNLHAQEVGLMIASILGIEMPSGNGDSHREWTGAQLAKFPRRSFQELLMALDEHEGHAKTLTAAQHKANKNDRDGAARGKAGD